MSRNHIPNAFLLAAVLSMPVVARASTLTVHVTGIDSHKGQIKIGIFDKSDGWLSDKAAITGQNIPLANVVGDSVDVTFANVKHGEYGVGAYHDANLNNKIDKNFLGVPKEQWGVSNNPRPHLRAPSYDEARFKIVDPSTFITLDLHK
jgi:uncharacterized protein (DUF2141 family)